MDSQPLLPRVRHNLARDLNAHDPAVRRAAEKRYVQFLLEGRQTAFQVLWNRQDAEDVVSEAMVNWLSAPSRYDDGPGSDLTWFKKVVHNLAVDWLRKSIRTLKGLPEDDGHDPIPEMVETMFVAIERLTPPEQYLLKLYLSWSDIPNPKRVGARLARELGISDKTAKARFAAALTALRREMHQIIREQASHREER